MLTVNRRHSIHKQFQATRDRQICRAWRVERHDKTGRQHRSARWVLAITGLRKPTCTGRMIKKCSLAVIGKVSAPASRIQVTARRAQAPAGKPPFIQQPFERGEGGLKGGHATDHLFGGGGFVRFVQSFFVKVPRDPAPVGLGAFALKRALKAAGTGISCCGCWTFEATTQSSGRHHIPANT